MVHLYYSEILDHQGQVVLTLQHTASAKHSAKLAQLFIESCPPAQGFNIRKSSFDAKMVIHLLEDVEFYQGLLSA